MDEILASIRRIIESGDERDDASGEALLSITPETQVNETAHANGRSEPVLASPLPHFDVHYLPNTLGEEPVAAREAPDAWVVEDRRASVEIQDATEDARSVDVETSNEPGEASAARSAPGSDVSDDAWWDAAVADANDIEAEIESAYAEASQPGASAELPSPDNENAVAPASSETLHSNWSDGVSASAPASGGTIDPVPTMGEMSFVPALGSAQSALPEATPSVAVAAQPAPAELPEARAEMPESVIAGASALLSMQAGDQVAAAFDDLTQAIRDGHMRSMEGMAREIMRPMLQEWLDDNLPRIVERLVRDEIERIARGPRR